MSVSSVLDEVIYIPMEIRTLDDFRNWVHSEEFPEDGRIDYIGGQIEVDMSPDNVFLHSAPKSEIGRVIGNRVQALDLGHFFIDKTRISCLAGSLSAEPDVVVVSLDAIASGRVRIIPTKKKAADSYIEMEGAPELVVEVLSDASQEKDTKLLMAAYYDAGVEEYWVSDARRRQLQFTIHSRGSNGFVRTRRDVDGFQRSHVLDARYRFERQRRRDGMWRYRLVEAE